MGFGGDGGDGEPNLTAPTPPRYLLGGLGGEVGAEGGQDELDSVPDFVAEVALVQHGGHVQADVVALFFGGEGGGMEQWVVVVGWGDAGGVGGGGVTFFKSSPWTLWEHSAKRRASVPHSGMPWGNWRFWGGRCGVLGGTRRVWGFGGEGVGSHLPL